MNSSGPNGSASHPERSRDFETLVSYLKSTVTLGELDHEVLAQIAVHAKILHAPIGEVLASEGRRGDGMYLLIAGRLEVFKESGDGERRKIASLGPGATVGEMSIIDGLPASATVHVTEQALLVHLSEAGLNRMAASSPAAFVKLLRRVARQTSMNLRHTTLALSRYLQRTADLTEALHQALEQGRNKTEFFATISHDLRTPLNAILGYSELVEEEMMANNRVENPDDLQRIQVAGRHMLDLINNLMDVSKLEAGKMNLHLETFPLKEMVQETTAMVHALAAVHRNRFMINNRADVSMTADPTKVRQALINLLGNAFKFTKDGEVTLTVQCNSDNDTVIFEVRDSGMGMTTDQMTRLFQSFSQPNAIDAGRMGSTGLGLFTSQSFCRMMGGRITVDSVRDEGSTFTMTLPRVVQPD